MWRTILATILVSIWFASIGAANDLMVNPSDRIPRAPIGHRQPNSERSHCTEVGI